MARTKKSVAEVDLTLQNSSPSEMLDVVDHDANKENETGTTSKTKATSKKTPSKSPKATSSPKQPSKKRKSPSSLDDDLAAYKADLSHIDIEDHLVDKSPQQIRTLIHRVIDNGIYKKGEFCDTLGVSSNSVNNFLGQSGGKGMGSDTYTSAWEFFRQREIAGLKMPNMKKKAVDSSSNEKESPAKKKRKDSVTELNLKDVHLEGEEADTVPIYDTCDEVRRKVKAHVKKPDVVQAAFCRELYTMWTHPKVKAITTNQLQAFRNRKGPRAGCTSAVFYAAYVYFEKKRIAEGKAKSKHREEMEDIYGANGLDIDQDESKRRFITIRGMDLHQDRYGQICRADSPYFSTDFLPGMP